MSLTSSSLVWLLTIGAIAVFTWSIIAWPRSAGPGWAAILRRVGFQLGVIVLVLLAVGVGLNDEYGWYANWSDLGTLFGGEGTDGNVVAAGAAAGAAANATSDQPQAKRARLDPRSAAQLRAADLGLVADPGPNGQYHDYVVNGPASRHRGKIIVWFPQAYTQAGHPGHRFPVLEAFHGIPGSPGQLSRGFVIGRTVAHEVAEGHIADSIIVMPDFAPGQVDTECVNGGAGQPQMETWLASDVTNWVDENLRVDTRRGSWATFGFSAGAYCASMLTMLHPDVFSAAVSLGGYYQPTFQKPYIPFAADSAPARHYDLDHLAGTDPPSVALWVQTSKADKVSYATAEQLLQHVRPPLSVTADVLPNAGHRISVWQALVPKTLQWLGSTAPGFKPAAAHL